MIVNHLKAKNWRNFRKIDVSLQERQFIVGANATGKSNFLDIFRFLRDIAKAEGGGLQKAVRERGGVSKLRCLAARKEPQIEIEISLRDYSNTGPNWKYSIGVRQQPRGRRQTYLTHEKVWKNGKVLLNRPDNDDQKDDQRLTQTYLEQINTNGAFREIVRFLENVTYLHLVPQLLRYATSIQGRIISDDPFGQGFLERVALATPKTRASRLRKIESALKIAVPQLQELEFTRDEITGQPHLQALYAHWRPKAGLQREDQFSDGTLRLIGLLWSLLDSSSLLLLEEPELNLNSGIVSQLAPLISRMQKQQRRQVLISTHSEALLSSPGIDGREVLLLTPAAEGTDVVVASDKREIKAMLESGFRVSEVVPSFTSPNDAEQLGLF